MSNKTLPNPGTHPAKTNGPIVIYVTERTGALCAAIPTILADGSWSGRGTVTLVKGNGESMQGNQQSMREIFGWDSQDPFDLETVEPGAHEFDIVGKHEAYTPEATDENPNPETVVGFKIDWYNAKGRGGARMPQAIDASSRRDILTKFAGKFGGAAPAPAQKAKKDKPAPAPQQELAPVPASAPAAPASPARPVPGRRSTSVVPHTSSQQEVWTAYKKANPGKSDDELAELYYNAQDEVVPGANAELTPAQWGQVAEKLGV